MVGVAVVATGLTACGPPGGSSNVSGGGGSAAKPTGSQIVIGTVGTYTGPSAGPNKNMPQVYKAWADWTNNNGGLNGHPVKIFVKDDKADAATSTAAVHDLVENKQVVAIVGSADAGLESTWADYVRQKNVPVVGGYAYTSTWWENPMFFPSNTTVIAAVYAGADMAKRAGKHVYGVVNCTEQAACAEAIKLHKAGARAAGLKVGYTATAAVTAPSYTAQCVAAKDAGVDALSLGLGDAAARFAADCARQGYKPTYVINATGLTPTVLQSPNIDGALIPLTTFPWVYDGPETKGFRQVMDMAGIAEKEINPADAVAFTSLQMFAAAMKNAPATVDRKAVLDGLYTLKSFDENGLIPKVSFSPNDAPGARKVNCYFSAKIKDGKVVAPQGLKTNCVKTPPA